MRKMMVLGLAAAVIVSGACLLACGGGEKQESMSDTPGETADQEMAEAGKEAGAEAGKGSGGDIGGSGWNDIPIYSGASRLESEMADRMSATMSGPGGKGSTEVRVFTTGDDYGKVVSYYKSHMSRKGWKKIMDREEQEGWGSVWQKGDGEVMVNVSVVKDIEGECGIIIGRHEGMK
jgi:hypothetical protein